MAAFTVTTSAQLLARGGAVTLRVPTGGSTVFVDTDSGLTTSTGVPVYAGEIFSADLKPDEALYVRAAGSQEIRYFRSA